LKELKENNEIEKLKNLVILGNLSISLKKELEKVGFNLYRYEEILYEGKCNPK